MPSAAQIKKLVQKAIKTAGDLAAPITYVHVTPGTFDPTLGVTIDAETQYQVKAVLSNLNEEESAWFIPDIITQKLIVAALDLPVRPDRSDYVWISGVRWEVKKVKGVPGDSVWRIYVQEP